MKRVVVALILLVSILISSPAAITYLDPTPYFGANDSPFFDEIVSGLVVLEDFEDGALNVPGVIAHCGGPISARPSVDEDDGAIDGDGFGTSFSTGGSPRCLRTFDFEFSPVFGGQLPTLIGMVMVDGVRVLNGEGMFVHEVEVSLFDEAGMEIGDMNVIPFPEQFITRDSDTHRFVGFRSDVGISRITVRAPRIDHLQFGIPEPSSGALVITAGALLLARRRRR